MAVTKTEFCTPLRLSDPTSPTNCHLPPPYPRRRYTQCSSCSPSKSRGFSNYNVRNNVTSTTTTNGALPEQKNCLTPTSIAPSYLSSIMDSYCSDQPEIITDDSTKRRSKSMGSFASSLVNARRRQSDFRNNNLNSVLHSAPIEMTSSLPKSEDVRVPVNGEATPEEVANGSTPRQEVPATTYSKDSVSDSSRKSSLICNVNPFTYNKYRDCIIGNEPWRDDSLSLSSSFSSSLSSLPSLPSPPSPASPPSFRPQSLPQHPSPIPGVTYSELLSSSLPETNAFHTICATSCGGSPRKRVKDKEGFIRRAACVCINSAETEVLLVSSKSSGEVWLVPGGGLEEGEGAEEAALREAYEEAGVRGNILAYLGLFESRADVSSTAKKHRTAVYVVEVTKEEEDFPERLTLGRQRKWMSVDDALAQLSRNRPRQSVYLQLLRATRLNPKAEEHLPAVSGDTPGASDSPTDGGAKGLRKNPKGSESSRQQPACSEEEKQEFSSVDYMVKAVPSMCLRDDSKQDQLVANDEVEEGEFPRELRSCSIDSSSTNSSESLVLERQSSCELESDLTQEDAESRTDQETDETEEITARETKESDEESRSCDLLGMDEASSTADVTEDVFSSHGNS